MHHLHPRRFCPVALTLERDLLDLLDDQVHGRSDVRREILECVSLNRALGDVSLDLAWRKPFDYLAERPFLKNGRGGQI